MSARAFTFKRGDFECFAQGKPGQRPAVLLRIFTGMAGGFDIVITTSPGCIDLSSPFTPTEARAMANALYQAADHAEAVIAETGLGESVTA